MIIIVTLFFHIGYISLDNNCNMEYNYLINFHIRNEEEKMKKINKFQNEYKYTIIVLTLEVFVNLSQAVASLQTLFA